MPFNYSENNSKEFQSIALPLLDPLYAYAFSLAGNTEEAEDLVQNTYLKAFQAFDSFQKGTNIKAWLFRILKNTFINEFHAKKRYEELNGESNIDEAYQKLIATGKTGTKTEDTEERFLGGAFGDEVIKALHSLPEEFRNAVYLADVEDLTYEEISHVMGTAVGTVRSRIARGRKILQVRLRRYAENSGLIKGHKP